MFVCPLALDTKKKVERVLEFASTPGFGHFGWSNNLTVRETNNS